MCPDSEHFGENPSLPKKAGLFLFGAAHPLVTGFWFLVCYATTQLATQLRQRCIQVVCSNKEARKRLTESNGTPAMDPGHMNIDLTYTFAYCCEEEIRIRRHTNKRGIEQNTELITIAIYFDFSHVSI